MIRRDPIDYRCKVLPVGRSVWMEKWIVECDAKKKKKKLIHRWWLFLWQKPNESDTFMNDSCLFWLI
jgi:hypothetical protein